MTRGPTTAHDRLLNLLYKKTAAEVKPRLPLVKRVLYEGPTREPQRSVLDDLMQFQWQQKPMEKAMDYVASKNPKVSKSIVLRLNCKNAYVGRADLINLYPVAAERRYLLQGTLEKGLDFHFVKARNPVSLQFLASYYLVFRNYNQACVYFCETAGKQINGLELNLDFVNFTENVLKRMASPFLASPSPVENFPNSSENYGRMPITELFQSSSGQLNNIKQIAEFAPERSQFHHSKTDPLFKILGAYSGQSYRSRSVIVRNLPFGVTGPALEGLLWDYEFENEDNPQASITNLHSDASTQMTLALLKFKDEKNARRFVRNYHGRRWEKVTNRKEKSLYEPILCEIAD